MKRMYLAAVLTLALLPAMPAPAVAQSYCATFDDGSQSCGQTLAECRQSISGAGGNCVLDQRSEIPLNLLQRLRQRRQQESRSAQPGSTWMPPPPGE